MGFRVSVRLLERAFYDTYGVTLHSSLGDEFAAFHSYSWAVRHFLPRIAYAEVLLHRKNFPPDQSGPQFRKFKETLTATDLEHHWELARKHKAGLVTRFLAVLIFITPKIGVLSELSIRGPKVGTEGDYVASVDRAMQEYDRLLSEIAQQGPARFALPDLDLDTGFPTRPGTYRLTDKTYATLLRYVTQQRSNAAAGAAPGHLDLLFRSRRSHRH